MIRLFFQDRNTNNTAVQYTRNTKKEKNYSVSQTPCGFLNFFPNDWEFLINFHTPIIRAFLH